MPCSRLLCAPGFSTRDAADRASGRGVGMAVVQTTVQELGGRLALDTAPGQGTRFIIELPLTLAITDAIIARVGAQTFAVRAVAVREVIEVAPSAIACARTQRDRALSRRRAARLCGWPTCSASQAAPGRALHVFVVGHGLAAVGLAVDRIVGQREIVVRTMADRWSRSTASSGATDLGDGRAVLILDAAAARRRSANASAAARSVA